MRFYVATGLERAAEAKALAEQLTKIGHVITYAWWEHGSVQAEGPDRIREVAVAELESVGDADLVVVLLPGGRGTHTEFGAALVSKQTRHNVSYGRQIKTIVLVGPTEDASGRTCSFYLHGLVDERFATVPEMLAWLRGWHRGNKEVAPQAVIQG